MNHDKVQQQPDAVQAMAEAAAAGSLAARNTLLLTLTPMIVRAAANAARVTCDRDDAVQDGYLRMMTLIDRYDPAWGVCFLHYAKNDLSLYFKNRTQYLLRRDYPSLDAPCSPDDPTPIAETLPADPVDFDAGIEAADRARLLKRAMARLSPAEQTVIKLALAGHDNRAIARMLRKSEKAVRNLKSRAKGKLT